MLAIGTSKTSFVRHKFLPRKLGSLFQFPGCRRRRSNPPEQHSHALAYSSRCRDVDGLHNVQHSGNRVCIFAGSFEYEDHHNGGVVVNFGRWKFDCCSYPGHCYLRKSGRVFSLLKCKDGLFFYFFQSYNFFLYSGLMLADTMIFFVLAVRYKYVNVEDVKSDKTSDE